jgi:hypothetical protein
MDLAILSLFVFEQRGYLPRAITHEAMYKLGFARAFFNLWGGLPGDGPEVAEAVERGEAVSSRRAGPGGAADVPRAVQGGLGEAPRVFEARVEIQDAHRAGGLGGGG